MRVRGKWGQLSSREREALGGPAGHIRGPPVMKLKTKVILTTVGKLFTDKNVNLGHVISLGR